MAAAGVLLILAAAALLLLLAAATTAAAQPSEADVLRKFLGTLRGPDGGPPRELSQWATTTQPGEPCGTPQWANVRCDDGGRVLVLQLEGLRLQGAAPNLTLLAPLRGLRSLSLAINNLTGAFPDVSALPALKFLFLSRNGLSGEIPDGAFAALRALQRVDLSNNTFSGPIPSSIATSSKLTDVNLAYNNFSGPVPVGLQRLEHDHLHVQGEFAIALLVRFSLCSLYGLTNLCSFEQLLLGCAQLNSTLSISKKK
jgi:hypothetical protein